MFGINHITFFSVYNPCAISPCPEGQACFLSGYRQHSCLCPNNSTCKSKKIISQENGVLNVYRYAQFLRLQINVQRWFIVYFCLSIEYNFSSPCWKVASANVRLMRIYQRFCYDGKYMHSHYKSLFKVKAPHSNEACWFSKRNLIFNMLLDFNGLSTGT